jgi:pilus assembly protein CpaE
VVEKASDIKAVLVGATDRKAEELLRECGVGIRHLPSSELGALAAPNVAQPHIVVVDLRKEAKIPAALAALRRQHPQTGVIIIASSMDPVLILDAMRSGVNECVAEPLSVSEVEAAVTRLVAHRRAAVQGQVIAFIGAKGGVGTTTMAVNVATALSKIRGSRTLLIDLHLSYGDAAVFLGAEPRFSIVDALENTHRLDLSFLEGLVAETKAGPEVLASSERPLAGGAETTRIHTLLDFVAAQYQYTVLDVPRSDASALDALTSATAIVVVANQEVATIRSAARIATSLRQRYGRDKVQIVVTRYDERSEISHEDIERVVGSKVKNTVPSDYRLAIQALNKGRPLVLDASPLAHSFTALARELTGLPAEKPVDVRSAGLFGSLLGRK